MIITPKTQLSLTFQNNVIDNGLAGLSWTPQGNGAKFTEGKFGRAYEFENTSNHLSAGSQSNACNVEDEYSWGAWIYINSEHTSGVFPIIDLGVQGSSINDDNNGFAAHVGRDGGALVMSIVHGEANFDFSPYGGGRTFWNTGIIVPVDEWVYVCGRRDSTFAECLVLNETFSQSEKIEKSLGSFDLWTDRFGSSRLWSIGMRVTNIAQNNNQFMFEGDKVNNVFFMNKCVSKSDLIRTFHGLHPISI